jgi:cold shock CspA family protein/ribosome-associated translation inhibitor RaiA
MQQPLIIHFRQMTPSAAVEARVREKVAALERFHPRITRCRVVVEKLQHRHQQGDLFQVRIDLTVPGKEIVVGRTGPKDHAHEDVQVALRDAFDAATRRLEDQARLRRGEVKMHAAPLHGEVVQLVPEQDHGFIRTSDGQEVYFHRHAVVGDTFDRLAVGSQVRLVVDEKEGAEGYQASTVHLVGKPQPVGRADADSGETGR